MDFDLTKVPVSTPYEDTEARAPAPGPLVLGLCARDRCLAPEGGANTPDILASEPPEVVLSWLSQGENVADKISIISIMRAGNCMADAFSGALPPQLHG